jgi:hypothetical protein
MSDTTVAEDDEQYMGGYCHHCGGEGFILTCVDDLCHGQGWCMHGDGEVTCMFCQGEG